MSNSASLSASDAANMQAKLRNLYQGHKPEIKITLNNKQRTYTTHDKLEGLVSIISPCDTSFDELEIEFVGTSRTYVERLTTAAAISGRSEAFHQFLKLQQPDLQDLYPEGNILEAGRRYDFPFVFVIPSQLLPKVCQHKAVSDTVKHAHLNLPPTLGCASAGEKEEGDAEDKGTLDDMCPDMASIRYGIFARISKNKDGESGTVRTTIESKAKRLRVVPSRTEEPPLDTEGADSEYVMRKERAIRKGVLKGRLGTIVMEAVQPPGMVLRSGSEDKSSSMAIIRLRFDPVDDKVKEAPRLGSLESKLKVCTYFASTARHTFPAKATAIADLSQGVYCEQLALPKRCMANVNWKKHEGGALPAAERRDSALSTASVYATYAKDIFTEPSTSYKGGTFWTAILEIPIALPTNKTFVPTFHTCLVSRIYQLKFELGVQNAGIVGTVDLRVPLQITSAGPDSRSNSRRNSVASPGAEIVEEFFQPRNVTSLPPPDYHSGVVHYTYEAPPVYQAVASRTLSVH